MKLLLDSHAVVWWAVFPGRLRSVTRAAISSPDNEVFLSAASVWELGLKIARDKLKLPDGFALQLLAHGFEELPVSIAHAARATTLPPLHGDPFDRLIIAQALEQGFSVVSPDHFFPDYGVSMVW